MKRLTIAIGIVCLAVVAALIVISLAGYKSLKSMRAELNTMNAKLDAATRLAQEESADATASSKSADEAAIRAEEAATGRKQAEQEKQLADTTRAQALTEAQEATQSAQRASEDATHARENAQKAEDQMAQMRRERQEELDHMQQALNRVVPTRRTPNGMVIVLPDSTFRFGFDSADLNQRDRELLSRIAGILLVSKGYGLSVYGYTDDIGSAEYNQQLSVRRAKAVEQYLVKSGLEPTIMTVKGYGKSSPLVPGTTAAARAQNRRVEIALADSSIQYIGEAAPAKR